MSGRPQPDPLQWADCHQNIFEVNRNSAADALDALEVGRVSSSVVVWFGGMELEVSDDGTDVMVEFGFGMEGFGRCCVDVVVVDVVLVVGIVDVVLWRLLSGCCFVGF